MQSKGLTNKLYRPIETNNATSKTPQSTPCQSKTPAEDILSPLMILLISLSRSDEIDPCLQLRLLNQTSPRVYYLLVILL